MRKILALVLVLVLLALGAAACGGDQNVPDDAVAVVAGEEITKAEFDALMARAKTTFEQQQREFPKAGTPEYKNLQNQAVQYLVQQEKYRKEADELDIEIPEKEVDDRLNQLIQQYYAGKQADFEKGIKAQGLNREQVKREIEYQLISEKLYEKATEGVKVTDEEIEKYYDEHKGDYKVAESREVRHILVAKKPLADQLRAQLQNGAGFAALAKKHSTDPGSKENGGKLTVRRGETVPAFDKAAFALGKNELSQPIKTQYGWHLVQPLGEIQPAKQTPLKDVKEQIRQQLLQEKRQEAVAKWTKELDEEYEDRISYQVGYAPPEPTGTTTDR